MNAENHSAVIPNACCWREESLQTSKMLLLAIIASDRDSSLLLTQNAREHPLGMTKNTTYVFNRF
jgi:hypothetical protein